jgi:cobalt-precorrin 5A hydrolase
MRIALVSFTREGAETCRKAAAGLMSLGHECSAFGKDVFAKEVGILPLKGSLAEWTADVFPSDDALVFVGACGIAVRAVVPHIRSKTADPAVVVVDEKGKYSISLLSGHLGGANDLAREIAGLIGAEPVITTATDLNQRFAVDDWAKKNNLAIGDMKLAKEISAAILNGETIGVSSDYPIEGELPELLVRIPSSGGRRGDGAVEAEEKQAGTPCNDLTGPEAPAGKLPGIGIRISVYEGGGPFEKTLNLIPRTVSVGMGCKKGISPEAAEELFKTVMKDHGISAKSVEKLCTIDIKKEEAALIQLAEKLGVSLTIFSAEELEKAAGEFTASEFVNRVTGVDNICERAAVLGNRGELIVRKQTRNGVTAAVAVRTEKFQFG